MDETSIPVGEATELTPEQAAAVLVEIVMQKMRQAANESVTDILREVAPCN